MAGDDAAKAIVGDTSSSAEAEGAGADLLAAASADERLGHTEAAEGQAPAHPRDPRRVAQTPGSRAQASRTPWSRSTGSAGSSTATRTAPGM